MWTSVFWCSFRLNSDTARLAQYPPRHPSLHRDSATSADGTGEHTGSSPPDTPVDALGSLIRTAWTDWGLATTALSPQHYGSPGLAYKPTDTAQWYRFPLELTATLRIFRFTGANNNLVLRHRHSGTGFLFLGQARAHRSPTAGLRLFHRHRRSALGWACGIRGPDGQFFGTTSRPQRPAPIRRLAPCPHHSTMGAVWQTHQGWQGHPLLPDAFFAGPPILNVAWRGVTLPQLQTGLPRPLARRATGLAFT